MADEEMRKRRMLDLAQQQFAEQIRTLPIEQRTILWRVWHANPTRAFAMGRELLAMVER